MASHKEYTVTGTSKTLSSVGGISLKKAKSVEAEIIPIKISKGHAYHGAVWKKKTLKIK